MAHKPSTKELIQKVLDCLVEDPKLSNKEIAEKLGVSKMQVAHSLRYLTEGNCIERHQTIDAKGRLQRMIVVKCKTYNQ